MNYDDPQTLFKIAEKHVQAYSEIGNLDEVVMEPLPKNRSKSDRYLIILQVSL